MARRAADPQAASPGASGFDVAAAIGGAAFGLTAGARAPTNAAQSEAAGEDAMGTGFFGDIAPIVYEGPASENPLAYRHYDATRVVLGKTMAEHLRPAVCYWHNFAWPGSDMFGAPTFERPWFAETMRRRA